MIFLFQGCILRFHVNLAGCIPQNPENPLPNVGMLMYWCFCFLPLGSFQCPRCPFGRRLRGSRWFSRSLSRVFFLFASVVLMKILDRSRRSVVNPWPRKKIALATWYFWESNKEWNIEVIKYRQIENQVLWSFVSEALRDGIYLDWVCIYIYIISIHYW